MTPETQTVRTPQLWLPLVDGLAWLDIIEAAEGRCECAGWCGARHEARRCRVVNSAYRPLHVIDPNPDHETGPGSDRNGERGDGLVAVCRACHARRAARRSGSAGR